MIIQLACLLFAVNGILRTSIQASKFDEFSNPIQGGVCPLTLLPTDIVQRSSDTDPV